jgi:hypothetical protein
MVSIVFAWIWLVVLYMFKAFCWIFVASSAGWLSLLILFAAYRVIRKYVLPRVKEQE